MENASLPSDVIGDNLTTEHANLLPQYEYVPDIALEIVSIVMGTIGLVDNLFVIVVFVLFIKIIDKVFGTFIASLPILTDTNHMLHNKQKFKKMA